MARIIIGDTASKDDLADKFITALSLLKDRGLRPRTGTKLLTKYAVIEVEDAITDHAVQQLRSANLHASKEAP
ncbi:MAG TPA: hypothetical protein VEJ86_03840 [Candidatus Binataceae bacterium]|nr:hypothetical protein [Candidatus Binataceae bacterium]